MERSSQSQPSVLTPLNEAPKAARTDADNRSGFDRITSWLERGPSRGPLIASLAALLVYLEALSGGFVHLDNYQVTANPLVTRPDLWPRIFTSAIWSFLGGAAGNYYRPLHYFSYWVIYRLAGPHPAAFHLPQILLYAATAWIVYAIARELVHREVAALAAAVLWVLHPQHVEPVAWISSLPDVGCGFFYLGALWLFLKAESERGRSGHWAAALALFFALLFKEMALSFPLLLVAYWYFLGDRADKWLARFYRFIPYLVVVFVYTAIRLRVLGHFTSGGPIWSLSPAVLAESAKLLAWHTRIFLWPTHLTSFRITPLASGWWLPAAVILIAVTLAVALVVRRRAPVLGFLLFWWPVTLAPCLDPRQLTFPVVADRLSYLPSVGLCLAIAWVLYRWSSRERPSAPARWLAAPVAAALAAFWLVQTLRTIPRWHANETLVDYSLRESPTVPLLHVLKGEALATGHADYEGARQEYETALRLNLVAPRPMVSVEYESYVALGAIAQQEGQLSAAAEYFERATAVPMPYGIAYEKLAALYIAQGDYARAAQALEHAVKINPRDLGLRYNLAVCRMKVGDYRAAAAEFRSVRQADPHYSRAYEGEAEALESMGDKAGAMRVRAGADPEVP